MKSVETMYSFKTTKEKKNMYKNVVSTTKGKKEENIMKKKRRIVNTIEDSGTESIDWKTVSATHQTEKEFVSRIY